MTWLTGNEQDYFAEWTRTKMPESPPGHATERWGVLLIYHGTDYTIGLFGEDRFRLLKDPAVLKWLEQCNKEFAAFCEAKQQ